LGAASFRIGTKAASLGTKEVAMADRNWGHCQHCKHFGSLAKVPLPNEEASCRQPSLAKFQLLVFGASGCNAFEKRPEMAEPVEPPGLAR
jgi:hypothetical protein